MCWAGLEEEERRWVGRGFTAPPLHCAICLGPEYVTAACGMVAEMVEALPSVLALGHRRNSSTPAFLTSVLRNVVVSLARLPLVNSYTRVPPLVSLSDPLWRPGLGFPDERGRDFTCHPEVARALPVVLLSASCLRA